MTARRRAGAGLVATVMLACSAAAADEAPLVPAQAAYVERCGGCHGIQGVSAAREVPTLRGRAVHFLCTPEGRAYLIRLPSVARSVLDDQEVADLMNFVVFDLGAPRATDYPRYTAEEVAALRHSPLTEDGLTRYRSQLVTRLIRQCGAPEALHEYQGPVTAR